jgi:hypothetical protein
LLLQTRSRFAMTPADGIQTVGGRFSFGVRLLIVCNYR